MQNELIIYKTDDGKADVRLYSKDGVAWMKQQQPGGCFLTPPGKISVCILLMSCRKRN